MALPVHFKSYVSCVLASETSLGSQSAEGKSSQPELSSCWQKMSSEPGSDTNADKRGVKKPCSFSIEDILSSPAEKRPQVLVPLCLRSILDCAPRGLCELETIPASSLQEEEEEEEEEELERTGCNCCCCSHTSTRSLQDSPGWLGECLSSTHGIGLVEGLVPEPCGGENLGIESQYCT